MVESCSDGPNFERHSKTEPPNPSKSDHIVPTWIPMYWFRFQMVGTKAVAMVPIIILPKHPKYEH